MEILNILNREASASGLNYLVIGGHAIGALGYVRHTGDLDLLICDDQLELWCAILERLKYQAFQTHPAFIRWKGPQIDTWPIDFMIVDRRSFAGLMSDSSEIKIGAATVRIPSLRHIIALKLHALKQGQPHRQLKDLSDIIELIKIGKVNWREADFVAFCEKYGTTEIYERIKNSISE